MQKKIIHSKDESK